ncbi:DNA- binding [Halocaridina rubra]|uniref:DNA- binding n=1 Tax=Halocaridina rubra TaxID=373956 RepID=A0AAN9A587_HALRR
MQRMDITEAAVVQPYKKKPEDPPFLTVGTEVSAKYKGAFCEAKVHKVVKVVKVKVTFKLGLGSAVVSDDQVKGVLKLGAQVKASHPDKNQFVDAIINKIQDCSQYTVVFDDGDITTLRRTSLCLKSGRHFAESETLDQLPLTHPEHFGTPVGGPRRGRRLRQNPDGDDSGDDEDDNVHKRHRSRREEWEADIGKVVCVELGDKKKMKDNWFPGLVVAPTAQDSVKIETKKDYLVRSFQDGRYYTVPKKEASPFSREVGNKVSQSALKTAVEKALQFMTNDELPPHWDRDLLFGMDVSDDDSDRDGSDSDSSDDEPREEKDHFVAQLYKFMEECGTPINSGPTVGNKDLDLYKLFKVVQKFGGFNRVMNQNQWKAVSNKMQLQSLGTQAPTHVKTAYKRYLQSFEDFYRKLGCTMVSNPRGSRTRHRSGRSLIRDCDRTPRTLKKKENDSCDSTEDETEKKDDEEERKSVEKKKVEKDKEDLKKEGDRKDLEKKDIDKKEEKKDPEKKRNDGKGAKGVKQEVKSSNTESSGCREKPREPLSGRDKPREPAMTRERSREPVGNREKSREKSLESSLSKERSRESSCHKESLGESVSAKEKREPRTPRSEAKTRTAIKSEPVEGKTRSSLKEEKPDNSEVKTRSSTKEKKEDLKKEDIKKEEIKKEEIKKEEIKKEEKDDSDNAEEVEMAQTRASKQREEKAVTPTRKAKLERTLSLSTCVPSCTSDNTSNDEKGDDIDVVSMSSSTSGSATAHTSAPSPGGSVCTGSDKKCQGKSKTKPPKGSTATIPMALDEASIKKRGRKRKLEANLAQSLGKALIPAHVPVNVGDKLRVLYGPNAKESKVTYEAKVLQVEEDGNAPMYYVHYLGWNIRYDEWVRRPRIAENITWSQNRARKGRAAATKELKEKKEKEKEKGTRKDDKDSANAVPSPKAGLPKRGRSGIRERRESERSERSDTSGASTVSGPSTRAARDKGLMQPDSPSSVDSKRIRRTTADPNESDSEDYESDADTGSEKSRLQMSVERRTNDPSLSSSTPSTPTPEPFPSAAPTIEKDIKDTKLKTHSVEMKKTEEEEDEDEAKPCGKNIDLNAIMSEMKGLDKPIKKEEDRSVKEPVPRVLPAVAIMSPEKKGIESPVKKALESTPKKASESPSKPVSQEPSKLVSPKQECLEDDIYEFKEPEPFDIGEMRARKDTRTKISIGSVGGEEQGDNDKFKKKVRVKKEGDVEKTESDSESGGASPSKRVIVQRENKETLVKRSIPDSKDSLSLHLSESSVTLEKKEVVVCPSIKSPPHKVVTKKDMPLKLEAHLIPIPDIKIIKPELPKCPSPKLAIGEISKSSSPLKEPLRIGGTPIKTKPSVVEKPVVTPHKPTGSHILAQAVMPIIESKAQAKPIPKPVFEHKVEKISVQTKSEEKVEPKVMPFSQRQQQIFPHLLNRSESGEKAKDRVLTSPVHSPSRDSTPIQDASVSNVSGSDAERIKRESSVEESIEAVIKRARQDQPEKTEESEKSESRQSPDKRRRTSVRTKKVLSKEFVPDTSEESDSDSRNSRVDLEKRLRRGRVGSDGEKHTPVKRGHRSAVDIDKKNNRKDDDDMDDEDADEEDEDDKEAEPGMLVIANKSGSSKKIEKPLDEKREDEEEDSQLGRKKPRSSASATPKKLEDEMETGLGDLLCEETIPPGSPMTHDTIAADSEASHRQDIKNEMPFASVPTGSSFGKRGPVPTSHQQHSSTSQQQLHMPQPSQPSSLQSLKQPPKQLPTTKPPQILVPQSQQSSHKLEPHGKQYQPIPQFTLQQKLNIPSQHLHPSRQSQPQHVHQRQQQQLQQGQQIQLQSFQQLGQQQQHQTKLQEHVLQHQHPMKLSHNHHQERPEENPSTPPQQQMDYSHSLPSRNTPNINNSIISPNLAVVAAVAAAAASPRSSCGASSSALSTNAPSTSSERGNVAAGGNLRPSENTVLDNTPPTTPESIISNLSDSPRGGDNDGPKIDESSKSGRDSSEVESLADNNKTDQFSEDSNTMDSEPRHHGIRNVQMKRQHVENPEHISVTLADAEGSETEESNNASLVSKRRRRGPRARVCNDGDDEDNRKLGSQGNFPGRRRRRHSSSRGGLPIDEDPETSGLSALSLACSAARRSRYNFCQELDPDLDASKRIAVLQSRIQELKRTYMQVKTELASVERRRKKLRRKERENAKTEPT